MLVSKSPDNLSAPIKTRFAPSPTGEMHFGNLRTALFNVLGALSKHGTFLLRIEDTDEERSSKDFEYLLYKDLKWLGLHWQEGADLDNSGKETNLGSCGPYRQSGRKEIYNKYYQELLASNKAYYCFCSEAQLALSRKLQRSQGLPPKYSGTCAHYSKEEVEQKIASGLKPTIRFRVENNDIIEFHDIVKGPQKFLGENIGDFIIRRASGTASFMFCNAIDDAMMGVNTVMRGEDHLTNTPRQLLILKALELPSPEYGHISLIVGNDGNPLSKRHGSQSLKSLREQGYLPIAILNYLSRLGHKYENSDKLLSLEILGELFKFENLSKSPAHYDKQHLDYWQKEAVLAMSPQEIQNWLSDYENYGINTINQCPVEKKQEYLKLMQENIAFPKEAELWSDILFKDEINYSEESINILNSVETDFYSSAIEYIDSNSNNFDIKELANYLKDRLNIKGKKLFMPIRICLTGMSNGPELVNIANLLGVNKIRQRFDYVLTKR